MSSEPEALNLLIARRLKDLRTGQSLSLDALARQSQVSRSMISVIERGQANPTAVVLDKLARALGVPLASLLDTGPVGSGVHSRLQPRGEQEKWRDPRTGYQRRSLSPPAYATRLELARYTIPAGETLHLDYGVADQEQQLWMLAGNLEIQVAEQEYQLEKGDCLALPKGAAVRLHNPGKRPARYLMAAAAGHGRLA